MNNQLMTLEEALVSHRVRVDFIKINGESRTMLCTKAAKHIPPDHLPKNHNSKVDPTLLKVYDLEKNGWRSMKIANIQSWMLDN
jgi:hypothetical protein